MLHRAAISFMATAAPEPSCTRLAVAMLCWLVAGAWALNRLPPDGSAGLLLGALWAAMLGLRWLPWARWGLPVPRVAGLCCPAAQPRVSDVAMGWMMGTLWWHAEGCLGAQNPVLVPVLLHLMAMALLLWLTARVPAWHRALSLGASVLALGASWLGGQAAWLCMLLWTLVWACEPVQRWPVPVSVQRAGLLLCGPAGLWWLHVRWPEFGVEALTQGFGVLALLALVLHLRVPRTWGFRFSDSAGGSA